LLGVSVRTAQLWIESGRIPSWKTPGGHRRVRRADVLTLIEPVTRDVTHSSSMVVMSPDALPVGEPVQSSDATLPGYSFPVAANELDRIRAVERIGLLDTAPEAAFDSLTWLAAEFSNMPIALVTLVTRERQWFKSRHGIDATQTPRDWAICNYTLLQGQVLVVDDLSRDERFASNPIVAGDPHLRFYAGAPVFDDAGFALGTLCVMDREPRTLDPRGRRALHSLAALASDEFRLRQATRGLVRLQRR
jgi:excisionase family DNA binding protein